MSGLKAGRALKRASKRKRRSKTIPALGAAGLSLTLASEASLAPLLSLSNFLLRNLCVSLRHSTFPTRSCSDQPLIKITDVVSSRLAQAASENNAYSSRCPSVSPLRKKR